MHNEAIKCCWAYNYAPDLCTSLIFFKYTALDADSSKIKIKKWYKQTHEIL